MTVSAYHGPIYEFATKAFADFMANSLPPALSCAGDPQCRIHLFVHLMPDGVYTRRIMVESEPGEALINVLVEASYQLFEGDTHYHVRRIGAVPRDKATEGLPAILPVAFDEIMAWHTSHNSIWEDGDD